MPGVTPTRAYRVPTVPGVAPGPACHPFDTAGVQIDLGYVLQA